VGAGVAQFLIAIYGGYFGGGIGFLMLAALTMAGMATRNAGATKNALAGVMNASAVALFVLSPQVHWLQALVLGAGALVGGLAGAWACTGSTNAAAHGHRGPGRGPDDRPVPEGLSGRSARQGLVQPSALRCTPARPARLAS
jgi:hypothetical protein